ncbi:MAG: AMP-binding protein, partial [Acidimicrobiales bacterium]
DAWAQVGAGREKAMASVRRALSGAAALAPEVARAFEERFAVPLWQGYGLTEASPAVSSALGTGRNTAGSVGRPVPGVEVQLVDDSGSEVLHGDPGEIWVRGPNVFSGYWNDPAATAEVLGTDGWLHTGDVAVVDGDGDLHIVDRRKDLVIVSGFNVYPAEVEKVVCTVPGVREAVALGRPDERTGESIEVVVVASGVSEHDIRAACSTALARYKCPTSVRFVEDLPRGLAGKALRRVLREQRPA